MTSVYLADLVVIIHLIFIGFVLFGGLFCLYNHKFAWIHLPVVLWGVLIEWIGWICPLTYLENYLRSSATNLDQGRFVEQYIVPVVYPQNLTFNLQILLGLLVIAMNGLIYYVVFKLGYRNARSSDQDSSI